MDKYEKATLDLIAWAEGTLGVSQNGYDIMNGYKRIVGWTPDTNLKHTWEVRAMGRYQFKKFTWVGQNNGVNKPINMKNQDETCLKYVKEKLRMTNLESRGVKLNQLENIEYFKIFMNKMAPAWASFPLTKDFMYKKTLKKAGEGFYEGQSKGESVEEFHRIYKKALSKYK